MKAFKSFFKQVNPDISYEPEELAKGIKTELEHTSYKAIATIIAKHHLAEDPQYYTKLAKKNFYCSCFRLQTKIDSGEVYFQKKFKNLKFNEFNYDDVDNQIRSKTLVALLKTKRLKLKINKNNNRFQNYYIIHPILRKISVNNEFKESLKNFLFKKLF